MSRLLLVVIAMGTIAPGYGCDLAPEDTAELVFVVHQHEADLKIAIDKLTAEVNAGKIDPDRPAAHFDFGQRSASTVRNGADRMEHRDSVKTIEEAAELIRAMAGTLTKRYALTAEYRKKFLLFTEGETSGFVLAGGGSTMVFQWIADTRGNIEVRFDYDGNISEYLEGVPENIDFISVFAGGYGSPLRKGQYNR
jgi:hypothetical protein